MTHIPSLLAVLRPADTTTTEPPDTWQHLAACLDVDPETFFPHPGDPGEIRVAREICDVCQVALDCLEFVMRIEGSRSHGSRWGIWAGTSPRQRARIYNARAKEKAL